MNLTNVVFDPETQAGDPLSLGEHEYVYDDRRVVMAVRIALITDRPLLITGSPGSGKSSLAADVARRLRRAYVETVVTSRTRLSDLVAEVDQVRRLNDAQAQLLQHRQDSDYLVPGMLWWAFDPDSARRAPLAAAERLVRPENQRRGVVVLLDEIDKAEPDLPNDLLGPLANAGIDVPFHGNKKPGAPTLVIITSNGEREMPSAFLRRCLHLELDEPRVPFLERVAKAHYGPRSDDLYTDVARRLVELQDDAVRWARRPPSTAEFLDAVNACIRLDQRPSSGMWDAIEEAALRKARPPRHRA